VTADFQQVEWDEQLEADCRALCQLAFQEDLAGQQDWTSTALVAAKHHGSANVVVRESGIVAGMPAIATVLDAMGAKLDVATHATDGEQVSANTLLASLQGNVRELLLCERTLLNLLGRLMGIATQTHSYVEKVQDTQVRIYDTRKTTLGWRRLEKYAVRCGGGWNHRRGLVDAFLIKDNHLAQRSASDSFFPSDAADAVRTVRQFAKEHQGPEQLDDLPLEIEVDTIEQLKAVLAAEPDIVLLDNMTPDMLQRAVEIRNQRSPQVVLEASGGVRLETLREIAASGVDRISVGALTHAARSLDVGLDWQCG